MAAEAGTGQRYATQVGRLWSGLTGTLARLEALAANPERLEDEDAPVTLRGLQYRLHTACERVYGLAPPSGTELVHAELAAALEGARDASGEIAEVLEIEGPAAAELLVYEWRGALFRVRLARLRLSPHRRFAAPSAPDTSPTTAAFVALVLAAVGATVFMVGASAQQWPVWGLGVVALCASFIVYKP